MDFLSDWLSHFVIVNIYTYKRFSNVPNTMFDILSVIIN